LTLPLPLAPITLSLAGSEQVAGRKIERAVALIRIISGHADRSNQNYNQCGYHYSLNHFFSPFDQINWSASLAGKNSLKLWL
jgi:hypothetical protein